MKASTVVRGIALPVLTLVAVATLLAVPATAQAQDGESSGFSLGFQSSWPSYGLSGRVALNERATLQGVLGALGTVTNLSGRLLYDFQQEEKYDFYGHGSVGVWRWSGGSGFGSESSVGFGGGVGVEFDLGELFAPDDDDFPPLFWNIEIGAVIANFDHYNFSSFALGGGIHWAF